MRKKLGKILEASFGFGGYQDAMIGLSLVFDLNGSGVGDFKGMWATKRTSSTTWTEEERLLKLGETVMFLADLLSKAKVSNVSQLIGIPVEVTFEGMRLHSWRILEEVI